jgi:hypothetical protein
LKGADFFSENIKGNTLMGKKGNGIIYHFLAAIMRDKNESFYGFLLLRETSKAKTKYQNTRFTSAEVKFGRDWTPSSTLHHYQNFDYHFLAPFNFL